MTPTGASRWLSTPPLRRIGDLSYSLGSPAWFFGDPQTRIGIRGTWRELDEYSPRYCPGYTDDVFGIPQCDPTLEGEKGDEWEIRTYVHLAL